MLHWERDGCSIAFYLRGCDLKRQLAFGVDGVGREYVVSTSPRTRTADSPDDACKQAVCPRKLGKLARI